MEKQKWLKKTVGLLKNNTIKNSIWIFGDKIFRSLIVFFISIVLARSLGSEIYGLYNYVISFAHLFMELAVLGLSGIVVREIVKREGISSIILGSVFITRLLASLFLLVLCFVVANYFANDYENAKYLILIYSGGLIFKSFETFDLWYQSKQLNKTAVICRLLSIGIVFILVLIGVYLKLGLKYFILLASLEFVLSGIFYLISYKLSEMLKWRPKVIIAKSLLSKSWPLILSAIGFIIYRRIDQVMLGNFVGSTEVGIYAVAAKLSEVWYYLPIAITRSYFPRLVNLKQKGLLEENLQGLYSILCLFAYVIAIIITLIGPSIVLFVYGEEYANSGTVLTIHIWACLFIFMREGLSKWFVLEDLFIFSLLTHGLGAISNVLLNLYLIPKYGAIGAAIATLASYSVASYFSLLISHKTRPIFIMMTRALLNPFNGIKFLISKT
ncbi:MAG: flippase [Balneolaceae bacterium]